MASGEEPRWARSASAVADMFGCVASASAEFRRRLELIAVAPQPLSQITVNELVHLVAIVEPAAEMRSRLAVLPPDLLIEGISCWLAARETDRGRSAADRAARAWSAGER